jgi:hypothetical protein|uniref:AttH domain-containing protein n=1 Tax=Desulfomonile tiedjei TaxID=2358 RepID=A0A7C4EVW7_9BACT
MTEAENFLTLFGGARGWDRNPQTYKIQDDAVHIADSNDHWEWWYFDFSFDNGYKAVATFHYRNMMIVPHIPTTQLFVYPPNGKPMAEMWALKPGQQHYAARDRCDVRMGDFSAVDQGDAYHVHMQMKRLGLDVTIRNTVPPWKAGTGVLWSEPSSAQETGWIVAIPRGIANGVLTIGEQVLNVRGAAYHDHNYGTGPMEKPFKAWYWGRLFDEQFTIIYGWVMPRVPGLPVVSPFMLARGSEIVLSTDLIHLIVTEIHDDKKFGFSLPMGMQILADVDNVNVDCRLKTERVVEALELPRGGKYFHYYRFLATYDADVNLDGTRHRASGETFHEAMYLD